MHLGCVVAEVPCCACALGASKDRTTGVSLHHNAAPPHPLLTTAMPMLGVARRHHVRVRQRLKPKGRRQRQWCKVRAEKRAAHRLPVLASGLMACFVGIGVG